MTFGLALAGCTGTATSEAPINEGLVETEDGVLFTDVLAQYQDLNTRLEMIAAPLLLANAELCPKIDRSLGLTVHTVTDYPPDLQPIARRLLGVSEKLSIRTVRDNSPANIAGLKPGDEIIRIAGNYMPHGGTVQRFYAAVTKDSYKKDSIDLVVSRDGKSIDITVRPETICGYPVNVYFSEDMNGHTDGEQILITSELMRNVPDNVNLALIIAHEMGHAIASHMNAPKSKDLELKADRMALILMERAGYDINAAISYWQRANHPHADFQLNSKTHPSIAERYENFKIERTRIRTLQSDDKSLTFD